MFVRLIGRPRGERLGRFAPRVCLRTVPLDRVLYANRFRNSGSHVGRIEELFLQTVMGFRLCASEPASHLLPILRY